MNKLCGRTCAWSRNAWLVKIRLPRFKRKTDMRGLPFQLRAGSLEPLRDTWTFTPATPRGSVTLQGRLDT